jgi:hypothetical protein
VVCDDSYYVLTQEGNVYRSEGSDTTGLPEFPGMAATLDLGAAPNPFNPSTSLHFTAPVAGSARLSVYDLAGREVALLLDAWIPEGFRQVTWQPRDLASGVYVARLSVGATVASRRLVLVK